MSDNSRVAKNAMFLYIRMFISMVVGLYTSRVVLTTLGVTDYGINGLVGGVVGMFGFINASMSTATARFIAFESGKNDLKRLNATFVSASYVHWLIAAIVFILAETVGLWFLNNKLVIPAERMYAAHWVYQLAILGTMLGISQVPYSAVVIAHEKMDIYAYFQLLSVSLKLLIVYLLSISTYDKLITYAILGFCVSILMITIWRLFCIRHYPESKLHKIWSPEIIRPMLKFSSWNLYGSICVIARQQGINFVINIFFGVIFNAASSIATTVQGIVKAFTSNITTAFQPHLIKEFAKGHMDVMQSGLQNAITFALAVITLITLPLLIETDYILTSWLIIPPKQASTFCSILLLSAPFALLNNIFYIPVQATGNIRLSSLISGTFFLLCLPATYISFKLGKPAEYAYYTILCANVLGLTNNIVLTHIQVPELRMRPLIMPIAYAAIIFTLTYLATKFLILRSMPPSFFRLVISCLFCTSVNSILCFYILLNSAQRKMLINKISLRFRRK